MVLLSWDFKTRRFQGVFFSSTAGWTFVIFCADQIDADRPRILVKGKICRGHIARQVQGSLRNVLQHCGGGISLFKPHTT